MSDNDKPIPIRLQPDLLAKIDLAATKLGWSKQDTMREAMKLGLAHYERINWDIQGAVLDASAAKRNIVQMPQPAPAMVATIRITGSAAKLLRTLGRIASIDAISSRIENDEINKAWE